MRSRDESHQGGSLPPMFLMRMCMWVQANWIMAHGTNPIRVGADVPSLGG